MAQRCDLWHDSRRSTGPPRPALQRRTDCMRLSRTAALIPLACLAIGGCRVGNPLAKAPTGQVVATVNGEEITARDLQAEMGGATYPDVATRKRAQEAAIGDIIEVKV